MSVVSETTQKAVRPPLRIGPGVAAAVASAAIGIALRGVAAFGSPLLESDEAALAWNIESRGYAGLMSALDFGQGAPVGFLLLVKLVTTHFGEHAYAYRVVPFIFGVLAIAAASYLAHAAWGNARTTILTGLLVACSGSLVRYSGFLKQYTGDALFSAIILALMAKLLLDKGPRPDTPERWWLLLLGLLFPWMSHPVVFVLAGGSVVLCAHWLTQRQYARVRWLVVATALWLLNFAAHYLFFMRHLNQSSYLRDFWAGQMLPQPPAMVEVAKWLARSGLDWAATSIGVSASHWGGRVVAFLVLGVAAIGAVAIWRRKRALLALLLAPAVVGLMAAGLRMYPFGGRLILFLVPGLALMLAVGIMAIIGQRAWQAGVVGAVVGLAMGMAAYRAPRNVDDHLVRLHGACQSLAAKVGASDHVYVFYPNRMACFYALARAGTRPDQITAGAGDSPAPFEAVRRLQSELDRLPYGDWNRVWVVMSHERAKAGRDERDIVTAAFDRRCLPIGGKAFGEVRIDEYRCQVRR